MIKIGTYFLEGRTAIPKCDSCKENNATKKVYTETIGIRLCDDCAQELKEEVKKL